MVNYRSLILAAIMITVIIAPVAAQNLLTNGDFENGISGWSVWKADWSGGYSATAEAEAAYNSNAGLLLYIGGSASFGVYQQVSVTAGNSYNLNGWWKGTNSTGNWYEVLLIDGAFSVPAADSAPGCFNNVITGYDKNASANFSFPAPFAFGYKPFSSMYGNEVSPYITKGTRVATGDIMTVVLKMGSVNGSSPLAYFDNVTLTAVPEPASIVALMTGLVGMVGIARRKR